jgi:hypothetical protein
MANTLGYFNTELVMIVNTFTVKAFEALDLYNFLQLLSLLYHNNKSVFTAMHFQPSLIFQARIVNTLWQ